MALRRNQIHKLIQTSHSPPRLPPFRFFRCSYPLSARAALPRFIAATMDMSSLGETLSDGGTAKTIHSGLEAKKRKATPAASASDISTFKAEWDSKSVWALWAAGPLQRYHILHWALNESPAAVAALGRFLLRVEKLYAESADKDATCKGLAADADADAASAAASSALSALIEGTRSEAYSDGFLSALAPVLAAVPAAELTCGAAILADDAWTAELVKYVTASKKPVGEDDFTGERLLGVGGFGMVMVGFKKDSGKAYALKRQVGRARRAHSTQHTYTYSRNASRTLHPACTRSWPAPAETCARRQPARQRACGRRHARLRRRVRPECPWSARAVFAGFRLTRLLWLVAAEHVDAD